MRQPRSRRSTVWTMLQHAGREPRSPCGFSRNPSLVLTDLQERRRSWAHGVIALGTCSVAMTLAAPGAALAGCVLDGAVLTCTGDLTTGVSNPRDFTVPPVETLIIRDLTGDIAPTAENSTETEGVFFRAEFSTAPLILLDVDLGAFAIRTSGGEVAAPGVAATAQESELVVNVTGDIFTDGGESSMAVVAATAVSGDITINSSGVRQTVSDGSAGVRAVILDTFAFADVDGQQIIIIDEIGGGRGEGTISVTHEGDISTLGDESNGVRALLGVGDIDLYVTADIITAGEESSAIFAAAEAGVLTIESTGNLSTVGDESLGIIAVTGFFGIVDITSAGDIQTQGQQSHGIGATVDGDGGITINSQGDIDTAGAGSSGLFATVFGDGGILIRSEGDIETQGNNASGITAASTGDADITVQSNGAVTTHGQSAFGIVALAENGWAQIYSQGSVTATGAGSAAIVAETDSGFAVVESSGDVTAASGDAIRAWAGSGGAYIFSSGDVVAGTDLGAGALWAHVAGNGTAYISSEGTVTAGRGDADMPAIYAEVLGNGSATIFSDGHVSTENDLAHALVAIAENGNAAIGAFGTVEATGADADAIHLEADSGFTGNVQIGADAIIRGGSGTGAAIALYGDTSANASNNFVTIGAGAQVSAASGLAIYAESGADTISNSGTVKGDVFLGGGANLFENLIGARFETGDSLGIGAGRTLNNFGELSPFGDGVIGTTQMVGNLVLQPEGTLFIDVAGDGTGDRFNIAGSVQLGGLLAVNALDAAGDYTIGANIPMISTSDGITGLFAGVQDNLEDLTFIPLSANGGTAIVLQVQSGDFALLPDGCVYTSPVIICSGNISGGAAELGLDPNIVSQDATALVVSGLTQNVVRSTAGSVGFGLSDYTDNGITIDVDLGSNQIIMNASGSYGISAYETRDGDIDITSKGTIRLNAIRGVGIYAEGLDDTDISIDHTGNIVLAAANSNGIFAGLRDDGDVSIRMRGNMTMDRQYSIGISAFTTRGNSVIDYEGVLTAQGFDAQGINAVVLEAGNIDIITAGTMTRGPLGDADIGIEAYNYGDGDISIVNDSTITGFEDAILADIAGDGSITITNNGDLLDLLQYGINAEVEGAGDITIHNYADIDSQLVGSLDRTYVDNGINAVVRGEGTIEIINRGDVRGSSTISGNSQGAVSIDSMGELIAGSSYGISGAGATVSITNQGNITTGFNDFSAGGISATLNAAGSQTGSIEIANTGDITMVNGFHGFRHGIRASIVGPGPADVVDPNSAPTVNISNVGNIFLNSTYTYNVYGSGIALHHTDIYNKGVAIGTGHVSQTGDITVVGVGVQGITLGNVQTNNEIATPGQTVNFPTARHHMDTTVDMAGTILATGKDSFGIRTSLADDVTAIFNLSGGDVTGGTDLGAGIITLESGAGALNVFNIAADVTVSAASGRGVVGGFGREEINLAGAIEGLVDLGAGDDVLRGAGTGSLAGDTTLGDGADRFAFEDGFSVTGSLDGGAGIDIIEAAIATGDSRIFDLAALSLGGFEIIEKTGGGTLTLASMQVSGPLLLQANGGLSTTSADLADLNVAVNSGARFRTDHLVGDVTVAAGGSFGGNATTGDFVNNGLLEPGNSIGTVTVNGDFAQGASGVLRIEFGPSGQTDLVDISGTASLDGALELILFDPNAQGGDVFTFLIADGGIDGAFGTVTTPSGLDVTVTVGANQIDVTVASLTFVGCVQTGQNVLCEGIDPDGFENLADTGLDTLVLSDALVLNVDGAGLDLGDDATVDNQGTINVGGDGIRGGEGSTILNNTAATILADGSGIVTGADSEVSNAGTITVDLHGIDAGPGSTVLNTGDITAGGDGLRLIDGNTVTNEGQIRSTGGNGIGIYGDGPNTIVNSGLIEGALAAIQGGDGVETLTNTGDIVGDVSLAGGDDRVALGQGGSITGVLDGGAGSDALTGSGDATIDGSITAFEQLTVESGTLVLALDAASDVTTTTISGGELALAGTLATTATTSGEGVLSGTGTIDGDVINQGTVAPGASIGTLAITGDYSQGADGTLAIEFGPTGQTDLLDIGGTASLDGTLEYYLLDNDVAVGDVFTFLLADGGVSGTFDLVNNALGAVGNFEVVYGDFDVALTILSLEGCIQTGSDVLCVGIDPNGFSNIVDDGLQTVVMANAVVNNPAGDGLRLGDGGAIENNGTIDATEDGLHLGADNTILNRGTIRGGVAGVRLEGAGNTLDNLAGALIEGPVAVTSAAPGQKVINRAGGTIDGDVVLSGGGNEVALETGSVLIGGIDLDGGSGDMLRLFGEGADVVPLDIEGTELLVKEGAGTWTLNDDLAVGETSVRQGRFIVGGLVAVDDDDDPETPDVMMPAGDAVLISPLVDVRGGILGGHWTIIGDLTAGAGGRVAPGTSIGTLTLAGNLVMEPSGETAGGVFEADLADDGAHDRLDIRVPESGAGGTATLAGTLDVVLDADFVTDDPETPDVDESLDASGSRIIQADFRQARVSDIIVAEGGVEGVFQHVTFAGGPNDGAILVRADDPATGEIDETLRVPVIKGFLEYLPDRVRITSIPDLAPVAVTPNQATVAGVLDAAIPYGLSTDPLTGIVSQAGVSGDVPAALDQLHGEWYNAFHEAAINFSRGTVHQARQRALEARNGTRSTSAVTLRQTDGSAAGASGDDAQARFWIAANYDTMRVKPDTGFIRYGIDTLSGYLGLDYQVSDGLVVGVMGGFGNADVDKANGSATGDVDTWQVAGYLGFHASGWFANLTGGYGEFDVASRRGIDFGTVDLEASADYDGHVTVLDLQTGYEMPLGDNGWHAVPELSLSYIKSNQDGFTETGAGPVDLAVGALDAESLRVSAQLRLAKVERTAGGGVFAYSVHAGVAHELKDGLRPVSARFAGMAQDFTVWGQPAAETTAVFGAAVSGEIAPGIALFLDYAGEMGGRYSDHSLTGGARIRF